jgi:hypothetical protein
VRYVSGVMQGKIMDGFLQVRYSASAPCSLALPTKARVDDNANANANNDDDDDDDADIHAHIINMSRNARSGILNPGFQRMMQYFSFPNLNRSVCPYRYTCIYIETEHS